MLEFCCLSIGMCQSDFPMLEVRLHCWYGKLLLPILVYYFGLPMLDFFIPILAYHFCLTKLDDSIPILAYHFCFTNVGWLYTNVGIYNTLPILVCHLLIPKIMQIYANEIHIISRHWNLKYFPVYNGHVSLCSAPDHQGHPHHT